MGVSLYPSPRRGWQYVVGAACLLLGVAGLVIWLWGIWTPLNRQSPGSVSEPSVVEAAAPVAPTASSTPAPTGLPVARATGRPTPVMTTTATIESQPMVDVDEIEAPWSEQEGRQEILSYEVQPGDTLWSIASQFGLDVDTIRWSNPDLERNPDMLSVGTELTILPVKGIYHTVQSGETLSWIAQKYGVAEIDISGYPPNHLTGGDHLREGQRLIVPHGHKELKRPTPLPASDSPFAWPLVGIITQRYGPNHLAIDIGAPYGSPVYAGRAGRVIHAGWARTGYGYTVIVDHGDGEQSLYSHMKGALVQPGDWVERGQVIGEVGSTGNSSGPHVHFEVRVDGERLNPLDYLPPGDPS